MPPTLPLVVAPQYCDGAYISKGGINNKEQEKMKKKVTQTSLIPTNNCQTLVILAHNCS
jgi:hypothetical protein